MKYIYENVEQELLALFNSIQMMPENWTSWCCLHAEVMSGQKDIKAEDIRMVTQKAISDNLAGHEGTVIFLGASDIYIFASGIEWTRLKNVGHILSSNMQDKVGAGLHFVIWDLTSNGRKVTESSTGDEEAVDSTQLRVIK